MYIKREDIIKEVEHSLHDNPHTDAIVRRTHIHEHEHFLRMLADQPSANVAPFVFKPGDRVWFTNFGDSPMARVVHRVKLEITPFNTYAYYDTTDTLSYLNSTGVFTGFHSGAIGKTVFATEAEALEHMGD